MTAEFSVEPGMANLPQVRLPEQRRVRLHASQPYGRGAAVPPAAVPQ
jgi:hypothetical protein